MRAGLSPTGPLRQTRFLAPAPKSLLEADISSLNSWRRCSLLEGKSPTANRPLNQYLTEDGTPARRRSRHNSAGKSGGYK
ncbi:hypothetical protein KCP69_25150 [Salmonella enterica subsp. enterica]|nr:hypothetical protein KCP69_25150 [Salmonella enterica subsp. enterica]